MKWATLKALSIFLVFSADKSIVHAKTGNDALLDDAFCVISRDNCITSKK